MPDNLPEKLPLILLGKEGEPEYQQAAQLINDQSLYSHALAELKEARAEINELGEAGETYKAERDALTAQLAEVEGLLPSEDVCEHILPILSPSCAKCWGLRDLVASIRAYQAHKPGVKG